MRASKPLIGPWCLVCLIVPACHAATADQELSVGVATKLRKIADGAYPSGTVVTVSQEEMTSYLRNDGAASVPALVQDLGVRFRDGGAVVSATVDLEKAGSEVVELPLLMRLLLRGRRPVALDIDYAVRDGMAAARLVSMVIEEVLVEGEALQRMVEFLAPLALSPYLSGESNVRQPGVREAHLEPGRAVIVVE